MSEGARADHLLPRSHRRGTGSPVKCRGCHQAARAAIDSIPSGHCRDDHAAAGLI